MSIGLILSIIGIAGGSVTALVLGRKWGLKTGERRAQQALTEQREELLRQQQAMEEISVQEKEQVKKIQAAQTPEEAADVLAQLNHSWNTGH